MDAQSVIAPAVALLRGYDWDTLEDVAGFGVKNQDFLILCHHRVPPVAKGHRLWRFTIRQRNGVGQGRATVRQADDKQCHNRYKPENHDRRQDGHQTAQEFQLCRFLEILFGRIAHGTPPDRVCYRGKPACAS